MVTKAAWNEVTTTFTKDVINGDADTRAHYVGKVTGEIALAVIGTKGVDKAVKGIRGAETVGGVAKTGQGFNTFNDVMKVLGSPGEGNQWHHIVEQSQVSKSGFSSTLIQNTDNLIAIDKATHAKISGYYSSKQAFTEGKTVRDWLAGQSYETQYEFGTQILRDYGVIK